MNNDLFAAALGLPEPWFVAGLQFDEGERLLTVSVDFRKGSRFPHGEGGDAHPVHDTRTRRCRHLNFLQHECVLEVRTPRVRLPGGQVATVSPPWAGRLPGFTLLFEALVVALCREMPFAAAARLTGLSWHKVAAICGRYVELALEQADFSDVDALAIDETSRAKGHDYVTVAADARKRRVVGVEEGRDANAVKRFVEGFSLRGGKPDAVASASIDMSPAFIKGVSENLPNARITFDKLHVVAHASKAVDQARRIEQRRDPSLKGLRWTLLKSRDRLSPEQRADLDALVAKAPGKRTARAWLYREQLREILQRKQVNVVRRMLRQWCINVNRSKVEPMKAVAKMIRAHLDGIVAWTQTRQTNGFVEALNGLFQAAKRKARGYRRLSTLRTVFFLIAGKLDFAKVNPHAA